jgi:lipoate-protein ligase A
MTPIVKPYDLKDFEIISSESQQAYSVWVPDRIYIVLGRANQLEDSVMTEQARNDGVEILKRPSGGETVLLSPGMLVLSYKFFCGNKIRIHDYFKIINSMIISALEDYGIMNLQLKGISDIAIGDKKIMGSSMYKKNDMGFYHAVLNVSESVQLIEKYLKHPKREPDYRKGRSHDEFVTSLSREGYDFKPYELLRALESALKSLH